MLRAHYRPSSLVWPPPTPHPGTPRNFGFRPYILGPHRTSRWTWRGLKPYPSVLSLHAAAFTPGVSTGSSPRLIPRRYQPSPDDWRLGDSTPSSRSYRRWVYADGAHRSFTVVAACRFVSVPRLRTTPPRGGAFEDVVSVLLRRGQLPSHAWTQTTRAHRGLPEAGSFHPARTEASASLYRPRTARTASGGTSASSRYRTPDAGRYSRAAGLRRPPVESLPAAPSACHPPVGSEP